MDTNQEKLGLDAADSLDPDVDIRMDNEERKSAQNPEENLDLLIEIDDWAANLALSLSLYEGDKSPDSRNK